MDRTTFLLQILGVINISVSLIIFYYCIPQYFFSFWCILLCSFMVGTYLTYQTYKIAKSQRSVLTFIPSDRYLQAFQREITACGMRPQDITLRYGYADDSVALTLLNTVVIDPMMWSGIGDDPECCKIKEVIETHILPGIAENKKTFQAHIKTIACSKAQCFIFRHELGHVYHNDPYKRIAVAGTIGTVATYAGLIAAHTVIGPWGGIAAIAVGMVVGAFADLFLSYSSNLLFKTREEKRADVFAARFSSKDEIEAAADFFEQYEHHAHEYRKSVGGLIAFMPTIILSGHPNGIARARYLREIARSI